MDVYYLNFWVSLFQWVLGMLLVFVFPIVKNTPFSSIPNHLAHGFLCWLLGHQYEDGDAKCPDALWLSLLFISANIGYNIFLLQVLKHGSTTIMFVASTVAVPTSLIIFSIPFVSSLQVTTDQFTWNDALGCALVILGLILYKAFPEEEGLPPPPAQDSSNSQDELTTELLTRREDDV